MSRLKHSHDTQYWPVEGPLGLPMTDRQAFALEALLKEIPREDHALKKVALFKAPTEVMPGERTDVSWISAESIDRDREIVRASGMDDSHFRLNPLVTMQHDYRIPPVGRSLWRKRVRDGSLTGIKAKTHYPPRPESLPAEADWEPDYALALIQADLMRGKSIGFLTRKSHVPTAEEIRSNPELADCRRIIDEWLLLEYACCFIPCQQHAVVEQVSKSVPWRFLVTHGIIQPLPAVALPHLELDELQQAIERRLSGFDESALRQAILDRLDQQRGRI
jgi:hypothetical protein